MKVRTYVLVASVALFFMASGSKNAKPTVGLNPGDKAPGIESLGNESNISFQNHSGRYTLLNFWAAYDAESRARNVRLLNEINQSGSDKMNVYSISLDEKESIFKETVKMDGLDLSGHYQLNPERESDLYKKFRLNKGFTNYLINDEGVIIATNVTPEKLTEVLNSI